MSLVVAHPTRVAESPICDMRREQRVAAVVLEFAPQRLEIDSLQYHVAMRIAENFLANPVTAVKARIGELEDRDARFEGDILKGAVALFFREVAAPIRDDQSQIASAGLIDAREVDLVQDSVTERIPDTAMRVESCANARLGAGSPARRDSRPARRVAVVRVGQVSVIPTGVWPRCRSRRNQSPVFHEKFTNL